MHQFRFADLRRDVRRLLTERAAVRAVDRFVRETCLALDLDLRRVRWGTRVVRRRLERDRMVEFLLKPHPFEPESLLPARLRHGIGGGVSADCGIGPDFARRIAERLGRLRRCLDFEERLKEAGLDAMAPPPSAYRIDLVTRRLLDVWDVDRACFVSESPKPLRSRSFMLPASVVEFSFVDFLSPTLPAVSAALPGAFPPMTCDFDVDLVRTRVISLPDRVRIEPNGASATVLVPERLPASVLLVCPGLPFSAIVGHAAFDDPALRIVSAEDVGCGTLFEITDPIVPLVDGVAERRGRRC